MVLDAILERQFNRGKGNPPINASRLLSAK